MKLPRLISRGLLLTSLLGAVWEARAQERMLFESPNAYSLQLSDVYLRTDVEMEEQIQRAGTPTVSVTRQRILVEPAVGTGFAGWAYHPNLLQYSCLTELGLDWQYSHVDPSETGSDTHFLQRYHLALDFLRQKPYSLNLYADKDTIYRDYDFFNRARVDTEQFGARSGYSAGAVPFTIAYQHYHEVVDDPTRPTTLNENTISLQASNTRRSEQASTQLNYNFDDYSRQDDGFSDQSGLNQTVSLFDGEAWGQEGWIRLSSLLNYNSISETVTPTDKLLIQESLRLQHTERLTSFYEYAYDMNSSGDANADTHQGRAGLTHQLYENLTSTADVHGNTSHSQSPEGSREATRYGVMLNEQYSRRLSTWGNLFLGWTGGIDQEDRKASGDQLPIIGEPHTLSDGNLTFLDQPNVVFSSVRVTDKTGTIVYLLGLDYSLIPHGAITEIRRVTGGRIPNGSIVLVDYSSQLDPSARFTTFNNSLSFRLDFYQGLFAIYGRWTTLDYSGPQILNLRWIDDKVIGADSTWKWFRTGAEYEVMDSNLTPYDRLRLLQSGTFQISDSTTFGLDFDQSWTVFRDTDTHENSYGFIAHYQHRFTSSLAWNIEGGVRIDRGPTFDRDAGTLRTELDWAVGKLQVKVGYEYGNETHPTDMMQRHYGYLRMRRTF